MAAAMYNLKEKIKHLKIDSIELIGGTSRIPYLQQTIGEIFEM
jgi:molecular chaperone DnaK (HSP70)